MTILLETTHTGNLDDTLRTLAAQARERYAGEHQRIDRGLCLALGGAVTLHEDGTASVQSANTAEVVYEVQQGHCDCYDWEHAPDNRCKHRWAVCLFRRATAEMLPAIEIEIEPEPEPEPKAAPQQHTSLAEYIVRIQGKPFVRYAGLLKLAHACGLVELTAQWTYNDAGLSLAEAVATFEGGRHFRECGDASPENVTSKVAPHFRRVALTRAKARVLRDALGVDMLAVEELAD
jgi:hypothetical protein